MNKKPFPFMAVFLIVVAIFTRVGLPSTRAYDTTTDPWQQGANQKVYEQAKEIQQKQGPIEFYPPSSSQTKTILWFLVVSGISFIVIIKLFVKKKNKK